jgi:hypothetical protein
VKQRNNGTKLTFRGEVAVLNQRSKFSYTVTVDGFEKLTASRTKLSTKATSHSRVSMILRTQNIYLDSDAVVAFVWTSGPGFGNLQSKPIELVVTIDKVKTVIKCGLVTSLRGLECGGSLGRENVFSSENKKATVYAQIRGTAIVSTSVPMILIGKAFQKPGQV